MNEIITSIAMLCQISIGGMKIDLEKIEENQKSCHRYYSTCIKKNPTLDKMLECVENRK